MASKTFGDYRWIEKDPCVDLFIEAKRITEISNETIHEGGGPTVGTLRKWEYGGTKKPQRLSFRSVMEQLGFTEQWVNGEHRLEIDYTKGKEFGRIIRRKS